MKVQLAVLADQANVAPPGKLNIMGIFDSIFAPRFPTVHPFMVLALRLRFDYDDGDSKHTLQLELQDEDGKSYLRAEATVVVPKIAPGQVNHANQILNFPGMQFTKPGKYHFRIMWDGEEKSRVDLALVKGTGPPPSGE